MEAKYSHVIESYPDHFESTYNLSTQEVVDKIIGGVARYVNPSQYETERLWVLEELDKLSKPGEHTVLGIDLVIRTK